MSYVSGPGLTLEQRQQMGTDMMRTSAPYVQTEAPSPSATSSFWGDFRDTLLASAQQAGQGGGIFQGVTPTNQQTASQPWTGNNIFRNATQGMGLNEGIYGNLLQTLTGQQNDPYGRPIPSSYTPPTALTGPVATYGGYGGGTNPTVPVNGGTTPTPTGGTGGSTGGGGSPPDTAGLGGGDAGGSSERDINREGGYATAAGTYNASVSDLMGALGIGGDFGNFGNTSLASIFGSPTNLLGYDEITPNLALSGAVLGAITGLPLGTLATLGGSYADQQSAIDAITQLNDPYGTGTYQADVGYLDGLLNNASFGLLGESYEDQALQDSLSQLQGLTMQDYYDAILGPAGVPQMTQEQVSAELNSPSLNETYQSSLRDQISGLQAQLAGLDPDTARAQSLQRQINELQGQLGSGGAYSSSTMDMLGNIADNARDSSTAVGADRERDQTTGDAASQSGPR